MIMNQLKILMQQNKNYYKKKFVNMNKKNYIIKKMIFLTMMHLHYQMKMKNQNIKKMHINYQMMNKNNNIEK